MAQAKADERLAESRRGLDMTGREMAFLAREVKAGPAKGQSVHHVFASRDDLPRSEHSFYRHVENEDIDVAKMDLRKKVRYKRRGGKRASRREAAFYEGRTYADYLAPGEGERKRSRWTAWRAPRGTPRPCSRSTSSRSGSRPTSCSGERMRPGFPEDEEMRVSHETIYQALYVQGRGPLREELACERAPRSGRAARRPRSRLPARGAGKRWVEGCEISLRPPEAGDRVVPGHWEGDLVVGGDGRSCLVTLAGRKTRYVFVNVVIAGLST